MTSFSTNTLACLRNAGWSEGHSYDTQSLEAAYIQLGCPLPEAVIQFIRHFHGLSVHESYFMDFELFGEIPRPHLDSCADYDDCCLGLNIPLQPLYPIGCAALGNVTFLMSSSGQVFAVNPPHYFAFLGVDGEDAIETLCSGRKPQ
jgi:hypothetical protein